MQKVHLWMDCSERILWSWTQSKATKIRAATVQSSVWTLQQILPDKLPILTALQLNFFPLQALLHRLTQQLINNGKNRHTQQHTQNAAQTAADNDSH